MFAISANRSREPSAASSTNACVAILPFRELSGQATVFGAFLAEELTTVVVQNGKVQIVERAQLEGVLTELEFDNSGLIDAESAKKIGKLSGASAILAGSITELATYVAVNCRVIDGQSGQVKGAAQVKIVKDADVNSILARKESSPGRTSPSKPPAGTSQDSRQDSSVRKVLHQEAFGIAFDLKGCRGRGNVV